MSSPHVLGVTETGRDVLIATTIVVVPPTLLVPARFVARIKSGAGIREDDWFILAALVSLWLMFALRYVAVYRDGLGHHKADLQHETSVSFQKVSNTKIPEACTTLTLRSYSLESKRRTS